MRVKRTTVREVQVGDIEHVSACMHYLDVLELNNSYPEYSLKQALEVSVESSMLAFTATWENKPAVLFGVCPTECPGVGQVWLLNDYRKKEYGRTFLQTSLEYIEILHQPFNVVYNYIWEEHKESLLWLKRLGFEKKETVENYRGHGKTFYLMVRERK